MIMTDNRKITVYVLATIAFIALFLLPVLGITTEINADATAESVVSSGDYVFFVVENGDVPLAAAPTNNFSSYVLWIALGYFVLLMLSIYSAWYLTVRRNIRELSDKLMPMERKAFSISQSFFHPIECYRLARDAENAVASTYARYM